MNNTIRRLEVLREDKNFYYNGDLKSSPQVLKKGEKVNAYYSYDLDCGEKDKALIENIVAGTFSIYGKRCCDLNFFYEEIDRAYNISKRRKNMICDIEISNVKVYYTSIEDNIISQPEELVVKSVLGVDN